MNGYGSVPPDPRRYRTSAERRNEQAALIGDSSPVRSFTTAAEYAGPSARSDGWLTHDQPLPAPWDGRWWLELFTRLGLIAAPDTDEVQVTWHQRVHTGSRSRGHAPAATSDGRLVATTHAISAENNGELRTGTIADLSAHLAEEPAVCVCFAHAFTSATWTMGAVEDDHVRWLLSWLATHPGFTTLEHGVGELRAWQTSAPCGTNLAGADPDVVALVVDVVAETTTQAQRWLEEHAWGREHAAQVLDEVRDGLPAWEGITMHSRPLDCEPDPGSWCWAMARPSSLEGRALFNAANHVDTAGREYGNDYVLMRVPTSIAVNHNQPGTFCIVLIDDGYNADHVRRAMELLPFSVTDSGRLLGHERANTLALRRRRLCEAIAATEVS